MSGMEIWNAESLFTGVRHEIGIDSPTTRMADTGVETSKGGLKRKREVKLK